MNTFIEGTDMQGNRTYAIVSSQGTTIDTTTDKIFAIKYVNILNGGDGSLPVDFENRVRDHELKEGVRGAIEKFQSKVDGKKKNYPPY